MISIAFLPCNIDACALYRMYIPALNLKGSRFVFHPGTIPLQEFAECDVAIVQRQVSKENLRALQALKQNGMKIIYDLDDNLWCLPSANPGKRVFEEMQDGFGVCASVCHAITVSTKGLASAVKTALPHLSQEVIVVPNAIDFNLFPRSETRVDDGRVVMGYVGSNTHGEDVRELWAVLPRLMDEFPQLHMEFIGMGPPARLIDSSRIKLRPWVPVGEFPTRFASWGWDISVAPLAENRFNRSKSCIKMLESAAAGLPCVVSDVQPYTEFCSLGRLDALVCRSETDWFNKIRALILSKEKREELAQEMRRVAEMHFSIDRIKGIWQYAAERAMVSKIQ